MARFLGVDGCKAGWFAVWQVDGCLFGEIYSTAEHLWADHLDAECVMVDMPIGLKQDSPRQVESAVRQSLGPRKSSVFPVPCFQAAYATSYDAASEINRQKLGKGLSKQAWFICPRICDLDQLLQANQAARGVFGECHPELAFAYLNGAPMMDRKKSAAGQSDRLQIVQRFFPGTDAFIDSLMSRFPRKDLQLDDCLDALVLTITATKATLFHDEPEKGEGGIPIRMWVPDC